MKNRVLVNPAMKGLDPLKVLEFFFQEHEPQPAPNDDGGAIFRLPDVMKATGLKRSTIYKYVERGEFPPPVQLTARAVGWRASEIRAWLRSRR